MALNLKLIVHAVLEDYALPWHGTHGVSHWARVLENGLRLAKETGANVDVVQLFAILHDSQRVSEGTDFGHGERAAEYAATLRGGVFDLPDDSFNLLYDACAGHTDGATTSDITIQTCWDGDRLDPLPSSLILVECEGQQHQPDEWGIDTAGWSDG